MCPEWSINPGFGTQTMCPFPLNRGVSLREVMDTKIKWALFQDQILCPPNGCVPWIEVSQRRGSTVFPMIKVLVKCYQSTSTLIVLGITKYNPQTITIIVHYQACPLATIIYGRKGLTLICPWVTKPWAAQISQVRALGAHYNNYFPLSTALTIPLTTSNLTPLALRLMVFAYEYYLILQSQSNLFGHLTVFLPSQCICGRFGKLTAITNIGNTRRQGRREKNSIWRKCPNYFWLKLYSGSKVQITFPLVTIGQFLCYWFIIVYLRNFYIVDW